VAALNLLRSILRPSKDPEKDERYFNLLLDTLKKNGIETEGEAYIMRYDPPWTPPFTRKNEVAIEVSMKS
jgi:hypothetical protein